VHCAVKNDKECRLLNSNFLKRILYQGGRKRKVQREREREPSRNRTENKRGQRHFRSMYCI
jgi:hypothetical protein